MWFSLFKHPGGLTEQEKRELAQLINSYESFIEVVETSFSLGLRTIFAHSAIKGSKDKYEDFLMNNLCS